MGSTPEQAKSFIGDFGYAFESFSDDQVFQWFSKQVPAHPVVVSDFCIGKYPVTQELYRQFEKDTGVTADAARSQLQGCPASPMTHVSFFEARAFCRWARMKTSLPIRLPSEMEWEFAASSRGETLFPWGNSFEQSRLNSIEGGVGRLTPVDRYPRGATSQGIIDMAGNAEEWVDTMYYPYPGSKIIEDHLWESNSGFYPILRGGAYKFHGDLCLASRRHGYRPNYSVPSFRIACSILRTENLAKIVN